MALLSLVLISAGLISRFSTAPMEDLVCDCDGRLAKIPVCGTDQVTYHNVCILKEAQKSDPKLGRHCLNNCPCAVRQPPSFCTKRANGDKSVAYKISDFDGDTSPEYIIELLGIEHTPFGEAHLQNIIAGVLGEGTLERTNEPSLFGEVCLTNGTTVPHMKDAACALAYDNHRHHHHNHHDSDSRDAERLGVRCLGNCNECAKEPPCPVTKKAVRGLLQTAA